MGKRLFISFCLLSLILASFRYANFDKKIKFQQPKHFPQTVYNFKNNPQTIAGIELGRKLFYETQLSRDNSISCATCHLQYSGFTHVDHAVSHGIDGRIGTRNSPVLINLAWNTNFHWDGGVNSLDAQFLNPIQHPAEMDNTLQEVIDRLSRSNYYPNQFKKAFGSETITTPLLMKALSQFVLTFVSVNSKYDKMLRKEKDGAFTEQELNGYRIFQSNCTSCHKEPLLTNTFFASNNLPIDTAFNDLGRFSITKNPSDSFLFKIPTLRNIEFSYPYMHDGRFSKLKDVINYYSDNVSGQKRENHITAPMHFSEHQKKDLLAFLLTLTDKEFLYNQKFSFPK